MSRIRALYDKIDFSFSDKVPIVHQSESAECGLAAIAMVSGFYGKVIDISALRRRFNLSTRGANLDSIIDIASELDLDSRAVSLELEELNALKLPCIIHWDFNHFVVLTKVTHKSCTIHDPAVGKRVVSMEEVSKSFTGIALELWPKQEFKKETTKERIKLSALLRNAKGIKAALTKIVLFSIVIEAITLVLPVGTQLVMDHVIPSNDHGLLKLICIGLILFIFLKTTVGFFRTWSVLVMSTIISIQWQNSLLTHLLKLPLSFFEKRKLGDVQSRFGSLHALQDILTTSLVGAIMDSIMIIIVTGMLFIYGGKLGLVVLLFTALYIGMRFITYNYYKQINKESLIREAKANSYFMETLYGIASIKMQSIMQKRQANWLNLQIDVVNTGVKVRKMDMLFGGVNTFINTFDQVIILWLGTQLVLDNQMTIGMFVAFNAFRGQFSERAASLTDFVLKIRMASLHNERISEIALHQQENVKKSISVAHLRKPLSLSVENISYSYDRQSRPILDTFSLDISAGESVALVGDSGVGKSTLMKLMCGLMDPTSGRIRVDGVNIGDLGLNNYRKLIGCILQEDKLLSGTIADNVSGFDNTIDMPWMIECCQQAYIHHVIEQMPMGYETLIGELGEGLSGGQKQRLFIARALYKKPGIIFMDEATSALDSHSEFVVNQSIKNAKITRVIISHRASTIESADRVINMSAIKS
ncbi:peptidase domain-containing ABC transporter [Rosenbergiella nectarea]|uniref:peptidase domain-containing ABC transporter n=1 Tax=Rosenbergiella nectarea TaxID=988801 RepID=UPI001BDADA52|nr:peptidase domain-containing ABC transporter [Rosenbergiella nectarea subsp. apis]